MFKPSDTCFRCNAPLKPMVELTLEEQIDMHQHFRDSYPDVEPEELPIVRICDACQKIILETTDEA